MSIRNPFKDQSLHATFDGAIEAFRAGKYHYKGAPWRGAGHRCAFWDGYNGVKPSAQAIPGTFSWAFYRAGEAVRKDETKRTARSAKKTNET